MRSRFEIYCDILSSGLLAIRNHSHDPEHCHAEADHLHNIPDLLRNFGNEGLHRYYWEAMTPRSSSRASRSGWDDTNSCGEN